MRGFSLLEVILVVGIIAVLSGIGIGFYANYARQKEIEISARSIIFDLKQAQAKSMAAEERRAWGAHFVNGDDDYYEIFSTLTDYDDVSKTIETTVYLSGGVFFTEPAVNASSTIIFNKIRGTTAGVSIVSISSLAESQTITVTAGGNIY